MFTGLATVTSMWSNFGQLGNFKRSVTASYIQNALKQVLNFPHIETKF